MTLRQAAGVCYPSGRSPRSVEGRACYDSSESDARGFRSKAVVGNRMNGAAARNPRLARRTAAAAPRRRFFVCIGALSAAVAALVVAARYAIDWPNRGDGIGNDNSVAPAASAASPTASSKSPAAAGSAVTDSYDGWTSERFAQLAEAQLHHLGDAIAAAFRREAPNYEGVFSQDVQSTGLEPAVVDEVFRDAAVVVRRGKPNAAPRELIGFAGVEQGVRELVERWGRAADVRYKFKLFDVDLSDASRPATRQYAALVSRADDRALEINATWDIVWRWDGGDAAPVIVSLRAGQFEEVESRLSDGRRLFCDCTASVLGDAEYATAQFGVGVDRWRRRIEAALEVGLFGLTGLAIGDANGDGLDDVYRCQPGGLPNRLLLHAADGTVVEAAAQAGVDFLDRTRAALFVDLDNDGDQDLVLTLTRDVVFLENDGRGRFSIRQRLPAPHGFSLAAADYDRDGDIDVYVCVYYASGDEASDIPVPAPQFDANNGGKNRLFENRGGWQFADVTDERGLDENNRRFSYAAAWEDVDNDGDDDLFVVNDFGHSNLYLNSGGRFRDVAAQAGLDNGAFGMSASFGDYDRDGRVDIYQGNMFSAAGSRVTRQPRFMPAIGDDVRRRFQMLARGNTLFRNQGDGTYGDVSQAAGVTMGRWSWASLLADINNDGWDDLLVANGFVTGDDADDL